MPHSPKFKFPLCDAAIRKIDGGDWELADAIVAECSETGDDGVRNESYAKMEAMRQEIAKNRGVELSFERIRKLRKVASAFPPGRRRPAVSLEGHLEAGTPEVLDEFINSAPNGATLTRDYIRRLKHPAEKAEQDQQKAERRHQIEDQRTALQNICRQQERQTEKLIRERRNASSSILTSAAAWAKSPNRFRRRCHQRTSRLYTVAEDLEQALRCVADGTRIRPQPT